MKFLSITFLTFVSLSLCFSQVNQSFIGELTDNKGHRIFNYCDFDYVPESPIEVNKTVISKFSPGYFFDKSNNRVNGLIKIEGSSIFFKANEKALHRLVNDNECNAVIVCKDSFVFISNPGLIKYAERFPVEVLEKLDGVTFYRIITPNSCDYFYKPDTASVAKIPSGYEKFKKAAIIFSGNCESTKNRILKGKSGYDNILAIIKLLKYEQHKLQNKKLYYNSNWDEVDKCSDATCYGEVKSINDSLFHMKYYNLDNSPVYEGYYSSFYPHNKNGIFTWYNPEGKVRKTIKYENNKLIKVQIFYSNGRLHYDYRIRNDKFHYNQVYTNEGKALLDINGQGKEEFFDSLEHRKVFFSYSDNLLKEAFYYDTANRQIFLALSNNASPTGIKLKSDVYPEKSVADFVQGTVLVKCTIWPSGYLMNYKIVKGLNQEIDNLVMETFKKAVAEKLFKPGTHNSKAVFQEIIVPVVFQLNGFSPYKATHYNFSNDMMYHQRMMNIRTNQMNQVRSQIKTF
jgi:hypothetical protein